MICITNSLGIGSACCDHPNLHACIFCQDTPANISFSIQCAAFTSHWHRVRQAYWNGDNALTDTLLRLQGCFTGIKWLLWLESVYNAHKQAWASASWESLSERIIITAKYCYTTSYQTQQYSKFSQVQWSLQDCQSSSFGYNQCRGYCILVKIGNAHVQPHTTAINCFLFFFDFTDHEDPWEAVTIMMVT